MAEYILHCCHPDCDRRYEDIDAVPRNVCDGELSGEHGPALLRPVYAAKQLSINYDLPGIFPYSRWLPVNGYYLVDPSYEWGRPCCYRSEGLARRFSLENLYIAFSGFWPEKGANLLTRTFKEFECQASIVRYLKNNLQGEPLPYIVASAGNTANGYNLLSTLLNIPVYLVVPESGCEKLVLPFATSPFLVAVKGDYADAGDAADAIADRTGLVRDGGVRNVARRAGLGTVMLNAVTHREQGTQKLFDHYFQAVSSAAGAIGAWEAGMLLRGDGRFGQGITKIHIAQNAPFTPLVDSWERRRRDLIDVPNEIARERTSAVTADVLTNLRPPYSSFGGVFDMLEETNGCAWRVTNYEIFHAARLFRETEGIDIGPAAAVAVDGLRQALGAGEVGKEDYVLLHVTGGGKEIQYSRGPVYQAEPRIVVEPGQVDRALEAIGDPAPITDPQEKLNH